MKFPRIIVAQYATHCSRCREPIQKGKDLIVQVPRARVVYGEDFTEHAPGFVHLHCVEITVTVK